MHVLKYKRHNILEGERKTYFETGNFLQMNSGKFCNVKGATIHF